VGVVPTSLRYGHSRVAHVADDSTLNQGPQEDVADASERAPASYDMDSDSTETVLSEAEQAIEEARKRLAEVPAEVVVTNHVMGLYELAAIHLSASPPNLAAASLAIDAVGSLVDGLGDRLGPEAPTLRDALANIRMAFVSVKSAAARATSGEAADPSGGDSDDESGD
jgi:hypothetical protein